MKYIGRFGTSGTIHAAVDRQKISDKEERKMNPTKSYIQ